VTDSGSGKARKFQITDLARRIIQDSVPGSEKRKEALKTAALSPTIHKKLWEKFGTATGLSEAVLKSYLTIDRAEAGEAPYSESGAIEVIQTYKATLAYAALSDSDSVMTAGGDKTIVKESDLSQHVGTKVAVDDYVQWTIAGVDQFKTPRRVVWVADDGSHARVHGETVGMPMSELTVAEAPKVIPANTVVANSAYAANNAESKSNVSVLMRGKRLEITADVDEAGLTNLQEMLSKYAEILKMMK
jgi:hypothetical protein